MAQLFFGSSKTLSSLRADWHDLPTELRFPIVISAVVELVAKVSVWVSLTRTDAKDIRGPKSVWFAATAINAIGPAAYWAFGKKK
ncbi:putative membrane protein [Corynebacterium deserti GIMN1.010]|uniref:Putative membrane protein n=1 Tax=Corynebacterium deserti GIMN1.010 TaxID=931089 RepID=A0A0M4CIH4_9CORY|nr:hypothetical protein [Corynebacterium deserti]ALC05896.1 putative membrane protein [Corynebacterium deserti GIMN1.010]